MKLISNGVEVIDNVACDVEGVLHALETHTLIPDYGFRTGSILSDVEPPYPADPSLSCSAGISDSHPGPIPFGVMDCVECRNRICFQGRNCTTLDPLLIRSAAPETRTMLDAAMDVSLEEERTLCRISELIYFGLEMKYDRFGVAFCADLLEPTEILVRLLRRHFEVFPVICKVGGISMEDPFSTEGDMTGRRRFGHTACNPLGQAEILNDLNTDLNVMVGLCMGVDCVFTKASRAPVTTLFVKDKSLANNPIGALYSEYYLKEVLETPAKTS
jgi:uncharacterized metal-binding protein